MTMRMFARLDFWSDESNKMVRRTLERCETEEIMNNGEHALASGEFFMLLIQTNNAENNLRSHA